LPTWRGAVSFGVAWATATGDLPLLILDAAGHINKCGAGLAPHDASAPSARNGDAGQVDDAAVRAIDRIERVEREEACVRGNIAVGQAVWTGSANT